MSSAIISHLLNLWPFSILKTDDLKVSTQLVRRLSIPEETKQFVFATHDPDSHGVVYILAAQNLSERSALDAEYLIKEIQPKAVIALVAPAVLADIQVEEKCLSNSQMNNVPTSSFGVLKRCFTEKVNREHYEKSAGCQVLQEIFGVGFYGHFLAAWRAAKAVDSQFLLLESPFENACTAVPGGDAENGDQSSGLNFETSCLLPGKLTSAISSSSRRFCLADTLQSQMVESLAPSMDLLISKAGLSGPAWELVRGEGQPSSSYQAPSFARSIYPLLVDLHDIFNDLPYIGKALGSAQKMLANVNEGRPVNNQVLSDVYIFRVAVEGLRVALNNADRWPFNRLEKGNLSKLKFSELPSEQKCQVLFAQALKSQAKKFGSVVAIVDAGRLRGLREHWNTSLPLEVADLVDQFFIHYCGDDHNAKEGNVVGQGEKKGILADKPVVAVGAGATAVLGASLLSKVVPASTLVKIAPATVKFGLAQLQRTAAIGLSKILGPLKLLSPGVASAGAKSSALKFTLSAEKIRAVTHSMIASAERTSLLAMRTSFYEIMRGRARTVRISPWATFGCSVVACTGLLAYGDGIECAAESMPSVPMIASLGRGLHSLQQASQEVKQTNGPKIKEALQSLMYNLKKVKVE